VKVGGTPGVTRTAQEVHLDKHVKLLDSPGIVFPKSTDVDDDIILRHCVQIERVPDPISPVEAILRRCRKTLLLQVYGIPDFDDCTEFLRHIAKNLGKLGKGGVSDLKAAARKVLQDWVSGKVPFYTEAPEVDPSIHVGAEIVSDFSKKFDISQSTLLSSLPPKNLHLGQALQSSTKMTETAPTFLHDAKPVTDEAMGDEEFDEEAELDESEEEVMLDIPQPKSKSTGTIATPLSTKKSKTVVSTKQDFNDEETKFNPQINQSLQKKHKKDKKKLKKQAKKPVPSRNDPDAYNFSSDFTGNDDGIDFDDIEAS